MPPASNASVPASPLAPPANVAALPAAPVWPHWARVDRFLVLTTVLLLAISAVVVARSSAHRERQERIAREFRQIAAALAALRAGDDTAGPDDRGRIPAGIQSSLPSVDFAHETPWGGWYRWRRPSPGGKALGLPATGTVLTIECYPPASPFTATFTDLREIDRLLDDGDLDNGRFRVGYNGWPVFVVEGDTR